MTSARPPSTAPIIGFWRSWSLTVGCMVGSGIFLLPSVLAPYGTLSLLGWVLTGGGTLLIALVMARLATGTSRTGGPYAYAHDAFGDLPGFLVAWAYWLNIVIAVPAVALSFAGYLGVLVPAMEGQPALEAIAALVGIWFFTLINVTGVSAASLTQLIVTLLKLVPLVAVILLGLFAGETANLPAFNPGGEPIIPALAGTALLTMWAYASFEAATVPAADVVAPRRTIPKAVITGTLTAAVIYIAATAAVMLLVPAATLTESSSPFADAAARLGTWGPAGVAVGALVATAGTLNGLILVTGQIPLAVAVDRLAPAWFGRRNRRRAPQGALLLSSAIGTVLLLLNYAEGLVAAFTVLISLSVVVYMASLAVPVIADLKNSWRRARSWAVIAALALAYIGFAVAGAGIDVVLWGAGLIILGIPVFYLARHWSRPDVPEAIGNPLGGSH